MTGDVRFFINLAAQNRDMAVRKRLDFAFVPRVVRNDENDQRAKRLDYLAKFMACEDSPISLTDLRQFSETATRYVERTKKLVSKLKKIKQDQGLSSEERKAAKLLRYINEMVGMLKVPVFSSGSLNLLSLYQTGVRDVTEVFSEDYFNRSFQQTLNQFLEIEPNFTTICSRCEIVSAGDNVEGILRGIRSQSIVRIEESKQGDMAHFCDFYGKPFKSAEDIRKGMDEAGTAGVYEDVRKEEGFASYAADFQEKIEMWERIAKFAWKPAPPESKEEHEGEMKEFRKLNDLLKYEMMFLLKEEPSASKRTEADLKRQNIRHVRHCVFLYLLDLNERFSQSAIEKNIIGLYALSTSVRLFTKNILFEDFKKREGFFEKSIGDLTSEYMNAEPAFIAMARLCDIKINTLLEGAEDFHEQAKQLVHEVNRSLPGYKEAKE